MNWFKKFLGIQTLEEKANEYVLLEKESEIIKGDVQEAANEHLFMTKRTNLAYESKEISDEIRDRVLSKQQEFLKGHIDRIKDLKQRKDNVEKRIEELRKDKRINEAIEKVKKREGFNEIKKAYKGGELSREVFDSICKAESGKVHYADVIVYNEIGEILFLQRNEDSGFEPNKWGLPGGHVDYGETEGEAAPRELKEETGLELEDLQKVGEYEDSKVKICYYQAYIMKPSSQIDILLDESEHCDAKWMTLKQARELDLIRNLGDNLLKIISPIHYNITVIKKAVDEGILPKETLSNIIEKARRGVYKDNPDNRKKGIVGMQYGAMKPEKRGEKKELDAAEKHELARKNIHTAIDEIATDLGIEFGKSDSFTGYSFYAKVKGETYRIADHGVSEKWAKVYGYPKHSLAFDGTETKEQVREKVDKFKEYIKEDLKKEDKYREDRLYKTVKIFESTSDIKEGKYNLWDSREKKEIKAEIKEVGEEKSKVVFDGRELEIPNKFILNWEEKKESLHKVLETPTHYVKKSEEENISKADKIPGGLADGKTMQDVMDKYSLSKEEAEKICKEGTGHEMEHTSDKEIAREIARDHIWEDKDYYKKLKKIEKSSIDTLIKAFESGQLDYDKIEKAHKYIRREGVKGNYKYIYAEPQGTDGGYKEGVDKEGKSKKQEISKEERDKNFKEWFGGSKVVDENGKPLVVYHGVNNKTEYKKKEFSKEYIEEYDRKAKDIWKEYYEIRNKLPKDSSEEYYRISEESISDRNRKLEELGDNPHKTYEHNISMDFSEFDTERSMDLGIHFGSSGVASEFGETGSVIPVYLKIEKMKRIPHIFQNARWEAGEIIENTKTLIQDSVFKEENDKKMLSLAKKLSNKISKLQDKRGILDTKEYKEYWKAFKESVDYDNIDGFVYSFEDEVDGSGDAYVAFNPNQIKSATGNDGNFSKDSNDITKGEENNINTKNIKDHAKRIIEGTEHLERLSPDEEGGRSKGGSRNVEATLVVGGKKGTMQDDKGTELDKEEQIEENIFEKHLSEDIEKGKKANIGEVREWSGKKMKKVSKDKWEEVREEKGKLEEVLSLEVDKLTENDFKIRNAPVGRSVYFGKEDVLVGFFNKFDKRNNEEIINSVKKEKRDFLEKIYNIEKKKEEAKTQQKQESKAPEGKQHINDENYKINPEKEYFVRFSDYIDEDLKRGWSSWNFGQLGFEGTEVELKEAMQLAIENDEEFNISGFELWGDDIKNADIRELYEGYWVLVDNENAKGELSAHEINEDDLSKMETVKDILELVNKNSSKYDGSGDGESFNSEDARIVYSKGNMHIIEV